MQVLHINDNACLNTTIRVLQQDYSTEVGLLSLAVKLLGYSKLKIF